MNILTYSPQSIQPLVFPPTFRNIRPTLENILVLAEYSDYPVDMTTFLTPGTTDRRSKTCVKCSGTEILRSTCPTYDICLGIDRFDDEGGSQCLAPWEGPVPSFKTLFKA